jgi:hypothetical protein
MWASGTSALLRYAPLTSVIGVLLVVSLVIETVPVPIATPTSALAQSTDYVTRAFRVYQDVMSGRRDLKSRSPEEVSMVLFVARILKESSSSESDRPECRDARGRARSAAEDVVSHSGRLTSCVESSSLTDDCSSEFRKLKNAHGDYESAVSAVNSYCR